MTHEALPSESIRTQVLALALSLHREVVDEEQHARSTSDANSAAGQEHHRGRVGAAAAAVGVSWMALVDASRLQFSLLVAALSKEPQFPPELVRPEHLQFRQ